MVGICGLTSVKVALPIELDSGIGLLLDHVEQLLEHAGFLPAIEAAGHRAPGAIALRQALPGGDGAQRPQHPIENTAMIDR
jgi:hypothetical protein